MSDRNLLEPQRALAQRLAGLATGLSDTRNRQRWQGSIQQSEADGSGAANTDNTIVVGAALRLDAGTWFLMGRFGVSLSSSSTPDLYKGTESFMAELRTINSVTQATIQTLDSAQVATPVAPARFTGGFFSDSMVLFGVHSSDEPVVAQIIGRSSDQASAAHAVPWRGGKLIALPF